MASSKPIAPGYVIRQASYDDVDMIKNLIRQSAYELSANDYAERQIEAALQGVFGVDTQLIHDGTYYLVERDGVGAACGGWSYRATLFGSDDNPGRNPRKLDPITEAAKIRAFFVHPHHARRGLGRWLLKHCEQQAIAAGFRDAELGATIPGRRLYLACGYKGDQFIDHQMGNNLTLRVYPMRKRLHP